MSQVEGYAFCVGGCAFFMGRVRSLWGGVLSCDGRKYLLPGLSYVRCTVRNEEYTKISIGSCDTRSEGSKVAIVIFQ